MRTVESRPVILLFFAAFALSAFFAARLLEPFFGGLVLAMILTSLFRPVHAWIRAKWPALSYPVTSFIMTVLIVVTVIVPATFFIISLVGESEKAYKQLTSWEFQVWLQEVTTGLTDPNSPTLQFLNRLGLNIQPQSLVDSSTDILKNVGLAVSSQLSTLAFASIRVIVNFAMMLMFIHTFFRYGNQIQPYMLDLLPFPDDQEERIINRFHEITSAVFIGNGFASLLQGIFGALAIAWVFDNPPILVWATVITILSFIPIAGAAFVFMPVTIWLWIQGDQGTALAYLIFNMCYVGVFEYIVKTKMIGDRAAMPNMLVLVAIVGGLSAYGVLGIFYGPLFMTVLLTMIEIYKENYRMELSLESKNPKAD